MTSVSVTWNDQTLINEFSSKTVELAFLEETLKEMDKLIADNQDALEEMELVLDEDELIPCKFGDVFVHSKLDSTKEHLQQQIDQVSEEVRESRLKFESLKAAIAAMKSKLYSKFGDSIQLEYD